MKAWLIDGLVPLSFWGGVGYVLLTTHLTIITVTVFYHRAKAHRALELHPRLEGCFRFWGWVMTGMSVKEWVGIHRLHHARDDKPGDPHSPWVFGLPAVLFRGVFLYVAAARAGLHQVHCRDIKDDWIDRTFYGERRSFGQFAGVGVLLLTELALFGLSGLLIWIIQMIWIPWWAAGVINGLGHWPIFSRGIGYRNVETKDRSSNIIPWGVVIGGEELHNNHHAYPKSAKLSLKPYEFDAGWLYIRLFELLGWARVKYIHDRAVS